MPLHLLELIYFINIVFNFDRAPWRTWRRGPECSRLGMLSCMSLRRVAHHEHGCLGFDGRRRLISRRP